MKQEIKERVERIRKGEVPEGYKEMKVGIIPDRWGMKKLRDAAEVVMGQSPVGTSYNHSGTGAPLINGPTEFTEKYPIKIQWTSQPTKFCKKGDMLLCVRGSSTGRMNISDDEYCIGRGVAAIRAKSGADTLFITFQVESAVKSILALTTGSTFPNIDGKSIKTIQFPLPPLSEQQKIVEILSIWDKAIELKEKLIEEKKEFKRGLMQKLLARDVRFLEFTDEWEEKRLSDILKVITRDEEWDDKKLYKLVSVRRRSGGVFYRGELFGHQISTKNLAPIKKNDFLISKMQVVHGALSLVENNFENYYVSGSYIILQSKEESLNIKFFNYLTQMPFMYHKTYISSYGVHIEKMTFNLKLYLKEKVFVPLDVKEQDKIVEILDLISTEIMILMKELNQLKEQKRGLMQLLLTGIVRVEVD